MKIYNQNLLIQYLKKYYIYKNFNYILINKS